MSLDDLRKKIDEADDGIVRLIAERMRSAAEIGVEKKKQGKQVEDLSREEKVLAHVRAVAEQENISADGVEAVYRRIMNLAKSVEGITVAFQGEIGAYSEQAAVQFFGPSVHVKPFENFDDVFIAVKGGEAQFGVVPIENSLEGSISRVYDLLLDSDLKVRGEVELRIIHSLIANAGASLDAIRRVYSHPQALGQCRAFLKHLNCELVPSYDTAGSVKLLKERGGTEEAAIAGTRAAEIYGMSVLASEIEDFAHNFTRFFVLAKSDAPPSGNDKTSIVFSVSHKPGALFDFLRELAESKVNLTKIESRPTRQRPWEYNFYLDYEGHHEDEASRDVLARLSEEALFFRILGSYPKAG